MFPESQGCPGNISTLIPANGREILFQDKLGDTGKDVASAGGQEAEGSERAWRGRGGGGEKWQLMGLSEQHKSSENLLF